MVTVTSFDVAQEHLVREPWIFDCVLSINDPDGAGIPPRGFDEFRRFKLAIFFDDVVDTRFNYIPPTLEDAKKIVAFAKAAKGKVLIHCMAGISRSTASAIAIPATRFTPSSERADSIMDWIAQVRPIARPNPLLVQQIDALTGWNGRLSASCGARFYPRKKDPQ